MAFTAGTRLGPYAVNALVGVGGMGEVYRATDTRLARTVAIKILSADIAADPDLRRRFEREAKAISSLNHPHICTLHDIGCHDGVDFLVMEYLEGKTLAQRIAEGALPLDEALRCAIEMADALGAAHERGIVHRDFKPANVTLAPDGVKLLDFGIATLVTDRGVGEENQALTVARTGTARGTVIGTVNYMSPEQARGLRVDRRTDIWAFGCVLFEMLTGNRAFVGPTAADTTTAILEREPKLEELPTATPEAVRHLLRRCLEKEPRRRLHDIGDARTELEDALTAMRRDGTKQTRPHRVPWRGSVPFPRGQKLHYLIASLLVLGLGFLVAYRYLSEERGSGGISSVAVLPFEDLSGEAAQAYFVDGMTDALITTLATVSTLRVTSRTSVMQFRGAATSMSEIGQRLNVENVVEGAVLREGERIRITVRLIDVGMDRPIWAQTYERDLRDILSLQNDLARAITGELRAALTPEESERLGRNRVVDPQAYDAYLRAREQFTSVNESGVFRSVTLFRQAVALDPTFAAAHAELGLACMYVANFFRPGEREWPECARTAAEEALSLDGDAAEAYVVRGRLSWTPANRYPHEQAIREFQRALALNPLLDEAHFQLGQVYGHVGFLDEYLYHARQASALSPENPRFVEAVAQALAYQRRYREALEMFAKVPVDSSVFLSGYLESLALFSSGKKVEAEAMIDEYLRNYPTDLPGTLSSMKAVILADRGDRDGAARLIEAAASKDRNSLQFHHTAYGIAVAYALMAEPDDALQWLEYAAQDGFPCLPLFERDENLDGIRGDPRFDELLERLRAQSAELRRRVMRPD